MVAIITDQLRILNAKDFVASVASTSNSFYSFVGLPNPTDVDASWEAVLQIQGITLMRRTIIGTQ